ncbi:hypothetical protein SCLCIDRAFT_1206947 [Scleroderma citrinum Foug A]|uniref:Uncharacterized protein n=1 Tax=Scleroderma citrinum Foug A TaxID=1036808 RepID=A0A0C3AAJ2_9AGAM|nr:hypothetical protein SCLCIDRAFT_1206947 [Scleroderma citrinum Foug A]
MIPIAAPGMLYPYAPGQRMFRFLHMSSQRLRQTPAFPQFTQPASPAANGQRPKRKQVKMAVRHLRIQKTSLNDCDPLF